MVNQSEWWLAPLLPFSHDAASQNIQTNGDDDDAAGNSLLGIGIDIEKDYAVRDDAHQRGPNDRAGYTAAPTRQPGSADGGRSDHVKFRTKTPRGFCRKKSGQ